MTHLRDLRPEVVSELTNRDFTCRLLKDNDEDIIKALECIYSHYGYDYLHQDLYDTEYFKAILRSGRYVATVAENRDHQVVGFGAIDAHPWFDGLMEMGGLIVNPVARGLGIGDMLGDLRIEIGRERGVRGLFSTPIMPNPASQKILARHGFVATGMYFHAGGPESLGGSGDGVHPMDCGFCVYIYDKSPEHELFPPDECREFLRDVYEEAGLRYRFGNTSGEDGRARAATEMEFNHETVSKLIEVRLRSIGADYREKIGELPLHETDGDVEAIMLLMSLNDPMCPACYEYLRGEGFIFTGCVPGGDDDLIVMEHLKTPIDRDYIMAEPDYDRIIGRLFAINGLA